MAKEWYVIHAYSGYENKVRDALLERINRFEGARPRHAGAQERDAGAPLAAHVDATAVARGRSTP